MEEMRENHLIEIQLIEKTYTETIESLKATQLETLDCLKTSMDVQYREENEARMEDISQEYDLRVQLALQTQFSQLNNRHVSEMKNYKTEMKQERKELLLHVETTTSETYQQKYQEKYQQQYQEQYQTQEVKYQEKYQNMQLKHLQQHKLTREIELKAAIESTAAGKYSKRRRACIAYMESTVD